MPTAPTAVKRASRVDHGHNPYQPTAGGLITDDGP